MKSITLLRKRKDLKIQQSSLSLSLSLSLFHTPHLKKKSQNGKVGCEKKNNFFLN
jgi:hypothetical protein